MIITCNECDTRFNIDESLLKQTGSKVRCSTCKNVFLAYPSSLSEELDKSSEVETELEALITDEEIESGIQYKAEEESEGIELAMDEAFEENTKVEEKPEESELDLELDLEPEIDETPTVTESELELELDDKNSSEISAGEELEGIELAMDEAFEENTKVEEKPEESGLELELDLEPEIDETQAETEVELELELGDKTDSEISAKEEPEEIEPEKIEIAKETETKIEESEQEDIDQDKTPGEKEEPSKTFNMGVMPDEQEAEKTIEPIDKAEKEALTEKSEPPKVAANKRISMPVLLLLLATLLISGAYGTYKLLDSVGINIPFVSDLLKPEVQDAGNLKIHTFDINNKFVENSKIGKLFVITGKAKNGYSDARSYISITGILYTKGKILSKTKTVYCGTILSELELQNMDLDAINNRLSNRFGDNKSNIKVKAEAIISFMVVFADLPENLDEFTIEVAGSFPS
ncbi:MAG: zinc-ribbon domain-containing protein [Deltaproteobacteria bacterium]|nr:zinc-ribbon domain-containing protein [Deltaproteobacteria bacterium]MBW2165289.1 zinc-ribbon domain-containing protein [Deltaproteobacteria bacterium]